MNYFAFFPALINEATNPNAKDTGFFANPAGPSGDQFAALGGQGISIVSYSENQEEAFKFLEWFIKDETQKKWAELGGYTCSATVLKSAEFQNATPYNKAFYETMFKVKDFWAAPEYAELLIQMNQRVYPYITGDQGTAKEALDALAARLERDLQEVRPRASKRTRRSEGAAPRPLRFHFMLAGRNGPWPPQS